MDSNKDEANRCIEIGLTSLRLGNLDKAGKMFDKAQRLFPCKRAEDLLKELHNRKHSNRPTEKDATSPDGSAEGQPRRRNAAGQTTEAPPTEPTYTPDQVTLVNKVLKCKDFYEVLAVCKESTDAEIKKAYKKLALRLHPDKNTAPGAVEAFKKVGNAVSILTDAQKRKHYDLYGPEEAVAQRNRSNARQTNGYSDYYDYDSYYSAEDVFNMYFAGFQNPHAHNGRRFRRQFDAEYQREGAGEHQQMTFGLILMIIVVLSMTSFFRSDPVYSLSPSSDYSVTRETSSLHVPYYVKPSFEAEYQGPLARLELSVEEQYVGQMKQQCYRERHYRDMMMARARSFGNKAQFAQAQEMKTPSCDNLYRIGKYNY